MLREYPYVCRACGFAQDLELEMNDINTKACPECGKQEFKQHFGKKLQSIAIKIPYNFKAGTYSFDAPKTDVYDRGANVDKMLEETGGDW